MQRMLQLVYWRVNSSAAEDVAEDIAEERHDYKPEMLIFVDV